MLNLKNMKLGKNKIICLIIYFFLIHTYIHSEDKILSSPLINLENLEPTFENDNSQSSVDDQSIILKNKNIQKKIKNYKFVEIIGLDKITAKTKKIKIKVGDKKSFGPLEVKVLKCGKTKSLNLKSDAAYLQVIDLSEKSNEKVFIFNGWAFSNPSTNNLFEHPVYDLWLSKCLKA
tara:strand:- start:12 stop:539 length:528 start_codon:yes stop_codon:yes gene_type:complete